MNGIEENSPWNMSRYVGTRMPSLIGPKGPNVPTGFALTLNTAAAMEVVFARRKHAIKSTSVHPLALAKDRKAVGWYVKLMAGNLNYSLHFSSYQELWALDVQGSPATHKESPTEQFRRLRIEHMKCS
jgi:hypothetical protein